MSQPARRGAAAPVSCEYSLKLADVVGALQLRWPLISG